MKQKPFQERVEEWLRACFGDGTSATSVRERSFRFIEEALELVQSCGMSKDDALQLVDYVYSRPVGEPVQEVGGTLITLSSLCSTQGIDMEHAADIELARCWRNIGKIRAKQASKPQDTPLPGGYAARRLGSTNVPARASDVTPKAQQKRRGFINHDHTLRANGLSYDAPSSRRQAGERV